MAAAACSDVGRAESGTELLARLEGRASLRELEPHLFAEEESPTHGCILELHGAEGAGKTELLYHLAARCVLPRARGGLEAEALFVDAHGHFDLLRLVAVLGRRLAAARPGAGEEEAEPEDEDEDEDEDEEAAVRACLRRLTLARCRSSSQLLLALHALEGRLCGPGAPRLLLLDGLSAFYWLDRADGGPRPAAQEAPLRACALLLRRLAHDYRLALVATTQSLLPGGGSDGEEGGRPFLCPAWQQAVQYRLLLRRPQAPGAPFSALVRRPGAGTARTLAFHIGEGGVRFC